MQEPGREGIFKRPLTRRQLLKGAALGALGFAAESAGLIGCVSDDEELSASEGNQVLSEEELEKFHIRIIPTPEVSLKLKKGVFNFPIFKDALKGKLNEVVIVLVDYPCLSWNASNKLSPEAKLVLQAGRLDPSEIPLKNWSSSFQALEPEEQKKKMENYAENGDRAYGLIAYIESGIIDTGIYEKLYKDYPEVIQQYNRYMQLQRDHPEMRNKIYIFIATGGEQKPHPDQSYLTPGQFKEIPGIASTSIYSDSYRYKGPETASQAIRHEIMHYASSPIAASEYDTDTKMLASIVRAAKKKQNGDESGYPFIFVTEEGETITKNQQASKESASLV